MKNAAELYLAETQKGAVNTQMQAELEVLRAKNQVMEEDLAALKAKPAVSFEPADEFDGMNAEQLREYVTSHTGMRAEGRDQSQDAAADGARGSPEKASA